jgi:hypothetical protein
MLLGPWVYPRRQDSVFNCGLVVNLFCGQRSMYVSFPYRCSTLMANKWETFRLVQVVETPPANVSTTNYQDLTLCLYIYSYDVRINVNHLDKVLETYSVYQPYVYRTQF